VAPHLSAGALPRACAVVEDLEVAHSGCAQASHMCSKTVVVQHGPVEVLGVGEVRPEGSVRRHGQHNQDGQSSQRRSWQGSREEVDRTALLDLAAGRSLDVANQQDLVGLCDRVCQTLMAGCVEHVTDADPKSSSLVVDAPAFPCPDGPRAPCHAQQISHDPVPVPSHAPFALDLTSDHMRLYEGPQKPNDPDGPCP